MNEWSPGENFYRPVTPNQVAGSIRNLREEPVKLAKPFITRPANNFQSKPSFQQFSMEDVSKLNLTSSNNKKPSVAGMSDPRFKRVIQPGMQNDACVGTELKTEKPSVSHEKTYSKFKHPAINTRVSKKTNVKGETAQDQLTPIIVHPNETSEPENFPVTEIYDHSKEHLKQFDKMKLKHHTTDKSFSKESLSDCTLNTGNASVVSEDLVDDYRKDMAAFSPSMRLKKVQNWIEDQKNKPDKKQSVITVIGQTQGQESLSSVLREIDERRKLVKELDKYAVCSNIIESHKEKDSASPVGHLDICNGDISCKNEISNKLISLNDSDKGGSVNNESPNNNREINLSNKIDCVEPAPSKLERRKKLHPKKKTKMYFSANEYPVKELSSHGTMARFLKFPFERRKNVVGMREKMAY